MKVLRNVVSTRSFWIVVVMLSICAAFHYIIPRYPLHLVDSFPLTRQAVVRIIFLLPVAAAAFAFGRVGGLVTLGTAALIMLPRIFLISAQPLDALFETVGVVVVGCIVIWIIETQDKEKRLRQKAVEELRAVNAIALTLTQPADLDAMLEMALDRVLMAVGSPNARGAILLLDPWGQTLRLRACKGLLPRFVEHATEIPMGECLCGLTARSGELLVVRDALSHPNHTRCLEQNPHSHVCVPLQSRQRLLGVIDLFLDASHPIDAIDEQMFAAIGRQVGAAVENGRLCENLRFFVRQITNAQEEERKRIARELHDDTAQGLIDLARRLENLADSDQGLTEAALEQIEKLQQRVDDLLAGVRRFSQVLRPSVLDDLGLLPALEWLMTDTRGTGIEPRLETRGESRPLSPEAQLALFRIVQEALSNVKRHANASSVTTVVDYGTDGVRVTVRDDGQGFEMPPSIGDLALLGRFGFLGMHERAQLLHGTLAVQSELGQGTTVVVEVPT